MTRKITLLYPLLAGLLAFSWSIQAEDLKAYYDQQKEEIAPSFKAPQLGTEITIILAAGQKRIGILMKLTDSEVSLMADAGSVTYKKTALHETSRTQLFADDYAHAKAMERTQEYKQQLHQEGLAEQQAGLHEGRISVSSKIDKDSTKEVEEDEQENKNGDTITTTKITRTQTAIQNLKITISNNTTHPDTYSLEWYFLGQTLVSETVGIHDSGTQNITVDARKRTQHTAESKAFVIEKISVNRESSNSGSSRDPKVTETGKEIAGYVVLLKYNGEIIDQKASASVYLSEEWMGKLHP